MRLRIHQGDAQRAGLRKAALALEALDVLVVNLVGQHAEDVAVDHDVVRGRQIHELVTPTPNHARPHGVLRLRAKHDQVG